MSVPAVLPEPRTVVRCVIWNQSLFTVGHSLTTGGFLLYFARDLGATGLIFALLLALPEIVGASAVATRFLIRHTGSRKRLWLVGSLVARAASLGIPLMAFPDLRPEGIDPLWILVGCLVVAQAAQAIAYTAYVSWLTDLVPEQRWGRFFAMRDIARVAVLLVVPVAGGYLRDWWREAANASRISAEFEHGAYAVVYAVGIAFLLAALIPLLRLPDIALRTDDDSDDQAETPGLRHLRALISHRSLRYLVLHNWWLASFNGLTQAVFVSYLFGPLGIGLGTYYLLSGVMRLVMLPVNWVSGGICDRYGDRRLLLWSVPAVSCAMLFWLAATPERWWLVFGAYVVWGLFAAVNLSGRNLLLKLAPRSDNAAEIALFRHIAGLLAGVSGVLGGIWLERLAADSTVTTFAGFALNRYQFLFLISWAGRATAALWILPVQEPAPRPES